MADPPIDLLALNREILLNPKAAGNNELVAMLELEKPGLEFLCPMARAIYLIETGRVEHIDSYEVLNTNWFIDNSDAYWNHDSEVVFEETTLHAIRLSWDSVLITLGFESHSQIFYCAPLTPGEIRSCSAVECDLFAQCDSSSTIRDLFHGFDSERRRFRGHTWADPTGEDFVGECRYKFVSVNDIPVDGPCFIDSYHEQSWEGLSEGYPQRWDCDRPDDCEPENSAFCWFHYLSPENAYQLGIAVTSDMAVGPRADYPEWVPKLMAVRGDECWIHSDRIQASYSKAPVLVDPIRELWFAAGCGSKWDPTEQDGQYDPEEHTDWEEFPEKMGPLLKIQISRNAEQLPDELEALRPYWRQLNRMRYS